MNADGIEITNAQNQQKKRKGRHLKSRHPWRNIWRLIEHRKKQDNLKES